MTRKV
jgi:hypothetical protein